MRNPILVCCTGLQGVGKSYTTLKQAIYQAYVAKHKRSALLFDTNNEYFSYEIDGVMHNIQKIEHNQIIAFGNQQKTEVKRIVPFHPNGNPMNGEEVEKLLVKVMNEYRGGTLIIEDLNRIYADALPVAVTGTLVNVRHRNCDIVYHMQSCSRMVPKLRQNTPIIRFHYQLDSISQSSDKLADEVEIFYIAEKLVGRQYEEGNIRFFVYIYREVKKIKGKFTPKMFSEAIQEYISENPKAISQLERKRGLDGKKMHTYEEVIKIRTYELFKKYYGNVLPGQPAK